MAEFEAPVTLFDLGGLVCDFIRSGSVYIAVITFDVTGDELWLTR